MIGFYDYTVWLTYASLISAVAGVFISFSGCGHPYISAICLLFCGLFDAFDGIVARTKQDRTDRQKQFGIQIDSLTDLIAFGLLPACIGNALYKAECNFAPDSIVAHIPYVVLVVIFVLYALTAMIRLAYFNVTAEESRQSGEKVQKNYTGLPVTASALLFPTFLLLRYLLPVEIAAGYYAIMFLTAMAFVARFSVRKPGLRAVLVMVGVGFVEFGLILLVKYLGIRGF